MMVWHYTVRLKEIIDSGVILPATANVPDRERPIVWFSINQDWERTATNAIEGPDGTRVDLDREGLLKHGQTVARIGVGPETAPHHWATLKRLGRIKTRMARGMVRVASECGADPMEWRGTFDPVPSDKWLAIEVYENGFWIPFQYAPLPAETGL
jgi:hypothetical protein